MPRTLYSPKLSNDVVRALYREGLRRCKPMTIVADELLRNALAEAPEFEPLHCLADNVIPYRTGLNPDAA